MNAAGRPDGKTGPIAAAVMAANLAFLDYERILNERDWFAVPASTCGDSWLAFAFDSDAITPESYTENIVARANDVCAMAGIAA